VEGRDTFPFFMACLRELNLLHVVEIRNMGGIDELDAYLDTLQSISGFNRVTSLGIIRDAEAETAELAFESVCHSLRRAGLPVPTRPMTPTVGEERQVSVFILPDCANPGMLETLCLQAVQADPVMTCVDDYFQCAESRGAVIPTHWLPKARARVFLASRPRPHLLVGQAAHEGYWPWDNPAFDLLKQFLRAL
jgi:hypothetical protein